MQKELFTHDAPTFAATRKDALKQMEAFIPFAGRYARDRNHVIHGHTNVSRLSPAIRYRLVLESECAIAPLHRYSQSTVEKFTQEVYWRRYWKSWLSLRPQVWRQYLDELYGLQNDPSMEGIRSRAARCAAGDGPIAIMNHFARELIATGYLHNHARIWFAGWWIHIERLPWQLGADFFLRHLLDGDAASNTLSWRWVAGLQTPGKTYLPRRSNLEKYLPSELLNVLQQGLEQLENPQALIIPAEARPAITRPTLPSTPPLCDDKFGIWIHEEDLLIEQGPLSSLHPKTIIATHDTITWNCLQYTDIKTRWLQTAIDDGAKRASNAFSIEAEISVDSSIAESLLRWANKYQLQQIAAMRPEVGPLYDQLNHLQAALSNSGIKLTLFDRSEDLALRPLATKGFFDFWEKVQKSLKTDE